MVAAVVIAGCGGSGRAGKSELSWEGTPVLRISPSTGAHVLIGTVKATSLSSDELKIKSRNVRLLDQRGRRMLSSVVFASSFVRSLYPQSGRPGEVRGQFPEAEQRRIGQLAVLRSGESVPLTVSWNKPPSGTTATLIDIGHGKLPVPESPNG